MIFFSICLITVLVYCLVTKQSPRKYVQRLRAVDWHGLTMRLKQRFLRFFARLGCYITRPIVQLYYSIFSSEVSVWCRVLVFFCLAYIVWPVDIVPYITYRIWGFLDDILVVFIMNMFLKNRMPPSVKGRVDTVLQRWFKLNYYAVV